MTDRTGDEVLAMVRLSPNRLRNKSILNVGAGLTNLEHDLLANHDVKVCVTNVDLAYNPRNKAVLWYLLGKAPRRGYPPEAVQADMVHLPFANRQFELSIATASLGFWVRGRFRTAIKEIARVTGEEVCVAPYMYLDDERVFQTRQDLGAEFSIDVSNDHYLLTLTRKSSFA